MKKSSRKQPQEADSKASVGSTGSTEQAPSTTTAAPALSSPRDLHDKQQPFEQPQQVACSPEDMDHDATVPQNEYGGVLVTSDQIHAAFQFLDVEKKNRVTLENLRQRLSIFYDNLSLKDMKLLLNDENELNEEALQSILLTNQVTNFDPIAEAFKAYDPEDTGFISREMLRYVFERLGYGNLTEEDLSLLVACADTDHDGRINLSDFRRMLRS